MRHLFQNKNGGLTTFPTQRRPKSENMQTGVSQKAETKKSAFSFLLYVKNSGRRRFRHTLVLSHKKIVIPVS